MSTIHKTVISIFLTLGCAATIQASHLMGGEITWECIATGPDAGKYIFTVKIYRDCNGKTLSPPTELHSTSPAGDIPLPHGTVTEISPSCYDPAQEITCAKAGGLGGEYVSGAMEEHKGVSDPVTLNGTPPVGGWEFWWGPVNARPPGDVNITIDEEYYLRAYMYPYIPAGGAATPLPVNPCYDNSPEFLESVALALCVGEPFVYNHLASDRDKDSIYVKWAQPWIDRNQPVTWEAGYSYDNPFPNPNTYPTNTNGPVELNNVTGEVSMDVQAAPDGSYVSCYAVESWKCGAGGWQKVAETYRDISITYRNGCDLNLPPQAYIDTVAYPRVDRDGQNYYVTTYPGDTVEFQLTAADDGTNPPGAPPGSLPQNVTFLAAGIQAAQPLNSTTGCIGDAPCASFIPSPNQNGFTAPENNDVTFFWTPDCIHLNANNVGCGGSNKFYFSLRMQDDACPAPAISLQSLVITVLPGNTNPVELKCISYEPATANSVESIRITWDQPPKDSILIFNYYKIYGAEKRNGNYRLVDSIPDYDQLSTTVSLARELYHFYIYQSTGKCDFLSPNSDTLSFMRLNMMPFPAFSSYLAQMSWSSMVKGTSVLPASTRGVYELWTELPSGSGNWTREKDLSPFELAYDDTARVCGDTISYQIRVTDTVNGCQSSSNIEKGYFSDQANDDVVSIDSVSVNENGHSILSWQVSSLGDVTSYLLLFNDPVHGWQVKDTIPIGTTMPYEWEDSQADERSEQFKIISLDSCGNQSNKADVPAHNTLYLRNNLNTCDGYASLSWNLYNARLKKEEVDTYRLIVMEKMGDITHPPFELFTGNDEDTSFTHYNLRQNSEYCYYVQAVSPDGTVTSSSNIVCLDAAVVRGSEELYLAQVTNDPNRDALHLTAYIDPEADVSGYDIERSQEKEGIYEIIGTVDKEAQVGERGRTLNFTDYTANRTQSYFYRLSANKSCGEGKDTVSNIGKNIVLQSEANANLTNTLMWNAYKVFKGGVDHYEIYRKRDDQQEYNLTQSIPGTDTVYVDDIEAFKEDKGRFCYYVVAVEGPNPEGYTQADGGPYRSGSNEVCIQQQARVFIPTAFRPESGIEANRTFGPSMRFEEVEKYNFYIMNRWGKVIFETQTPGKEWNGQVNGEPAPIGVYVYYVKYSTVDDIPKEEKGSFTLVN